MLLAIEREQAKQILDKYYKVLSSSGYVRHDIVVRYMIWLYVVDFVERVYHLLTNGDYNRINRLLIALFGPKSCLLPYLTRRTDLTIGNGMYMGMFDLRATEDTKLRESEDERLRRMAH